MNKVIKEKYKRLILFAVIFIAFVFVVSVMIVYENEGETQMPFKLSEILIISSADGVNDDDEDTKWSLTINQYNDFYFDFSKNEELNSVAYIKSIKFENFQYDNEGRNIKIYMPSSTDDTETFVYDDQFLVNTDLTYTGSGATSTKTLEVGNQGGMVAFRVANLGIGNIVSDELEEVSYDGSLLNKTEVDEENLKFNISFDIVIETDKNTFRSNVNFDLPVGDIKTEKTSKYSTTDCDFVIFKRD